MPRFARLDNLADRRAARRTERARARAVRAGKKRDRRTRALKALALVLVLALLALLGFVVGDDSYQATLIGWAPFLIVLVGVAVSAVYSAVLKGGIGFEEMTNVGSCRRDSEVVFSVAFKNRTPLLASRIVAHFYIADMFDNVANEGATTLSLSPFETYDLKFTTRFEHLGTYHAGLREIEVADALGLFTSVLPNEDQSEVEVTPQILDLDAIEFSNTSMDEQTRAAKSVLADSMEYAYSREYVRGDPLKTIHWKLSARTGTFMTRLYEVYTNPSVLVIMDFYADSNEARDLMTMFDTVVESAFSIARFAARQGMDVAVAFCDRYGEDRMVTGLDDDAVTQTVSDLPRMSNDPADASSAIDILQRQTASPRGFNNIFVCTPNVGADMVSAVVGVKLARRSPAMVAVVPPSLLDDRERQSHCAALMRFEDDGIPYSIVTHASDLRGGGER